MPLLYPNKPMPKSANGNKNDKKKRSQRLVIVGACVLLVLSAVLLYVIIRGSTRRESQDPFTPTTTDQTVTSTNQVLRHIDGVPVEPGMADKRPISVMIDNQADAQPWSGVNKASLVIESPVEGGITRLMAVFDPSLATSTLIGPVRSARPYFVDWAKAWGAGYAHVGGSPEALEKISKLGKIFGNLDEMANSATFYRDSSKPAPHNVYTTVGSLSAAMDARYGTSTATFTPWRFEPLVTSTDAVIAASSVRIPYGGSYSITWRYDATLGLYRRLKGTTVQKTREGEELLAANVIVLKTDSQVLDEKGRLSVRTVGSGDAVLYRAGKKYIARWSRSPDELIRLEGADGSEYSLTSGTTWIEVTTDDRVFGGLIPTTPSTTTTTTSTPAGT